MEYNSLKFEINSGIMKNILVPVDFSEPSRAAALYAIQLAEVLHAKIHLLSVEDSVPETVAFRNTQQWREIVLQNGLEAGKPWVDELKKQASERVEIVFSCKSGWPIFTVIEHYTTDHRIDLIVMGSKGASGIKKVILGSNAASVINQSSVPVIVVPMHHVFKGIKSIIYATDMEHLDLQIDKVNEFARAFDAKLHIVHVQAEGAMEEASATSAYQQVDKISAADTHFHLFKSIPVAKALEDYVKKEKGDLLVLFTHKLDFFEKLLQTSVTRILASDNQIPVLTFIKRNGE